MTNQRVIECLNNRPVVVIAIGVEKETGCKTFLMEYSTIATATKSVLLDNENQKTLIIYDSLDLRVKSNFLEKMGYDVTGISKDLSRMINNWKKDYENELLILDDLESEYAD